MIIAGMGKATLLAITLIVIYLALQKPSEPAPRVQDIKSEPTQAVLSEPKTSQVQKLKLSLSGVEYQLRLRKLQENEGITLIPNLEKKLSSQEVFSSASCDFLINGGFYTSSNSPLGLLFLEGKTLSPNIRSGFLNGYLGLSRTGTLSLSSQAPQDLSGYSFVLQSGPYISLEDGQPPKFEETKDRRALVAENQSGEKYFVAILEENNYFSGPKLGDLKQLLQLLNQTYSLNLKKAINLDGGSTLAFLQSGEESIPEIKKVGSFLCLKAD